MKIGMVLDAPYPEDGRVTKEALALIEDGHRVALLCVRRPGEPERVEAQGIRVVRVRRGLSLFAKTAWDSVTALLWRHPVFDNALPGFIRDEGIEVLHVHDLPLAGSVAGAAQRAGLPWVLDLHENYPAGLQTWMEHKTNPVVLLKNRLLMGYPRWVRYEAKMVERADAVIGVVDEMKDRLVRLHDVDPDKVSVVTNSEWRDFMDQYPALEEVADSYPGEYLILYLGFFGPHRGVDTVIRAMPRILEQVPNARFLIVGRGSYQPDLEQLAGELGVRERVVFAGFKPYAEIGSWMRRADVNITPHKRNEHTDNTVPHKLFHSLLAGRATVVSSAPPLRRIAGETGGAFVFEAENEEDLARVVVEVHGNEAERSERARKGRYAATEGVHNWDTDQQNLRRLYRRLGEVSAPGR